MDGAKILREAWNYDVFTGKYADVLIPLYDNEESVCGIIYNNTPYYFQKNQQGDVVAIFDANCDVVARYTYDAWGKVSAITGTNLEIAYINPFRYRSYTYDQEIGMYYLQSRYYDPEVGRFVNGDEPLCLVIENVVLGHCLYTYCGNDAVNACDPGGNSAALTMALPLALKASAPVITPLISIGTTNSWNPVGWAALIIFILLLAVLLGAYYYQKRIKQLSKRKSLSDVKAKLPSGKVYYLAYITTKGELAKIGKPMNFQTALASLGITGASNSLNKRYKYNKKKSSSAQRTLQPLGSGQWGIYTNSQTAAKALAIVLGYNSAPEVEGTNMYGHYHDSTHSFHIWFGGKMSY